MLVCRAKSYIIYSRDKACKGVACEKRCAYAPKEREE